MLLILSPSKTLDFEKQRLTRRYSTPAFLEDSTELIECLRELSPDQLVKLMGIGAELAEATCEQYASWSTPLTPSNAKQAVLAFRGNAYVGLAAEEYSAADFGRAQKSLRILSALYGVLKPLDLMQPYRLEMGTRLESTRGKNLYEFWGTRITDALNGELKKMKKPMLVNLASNEYFKSLKPKLLAAPIVTPAFKELRNGTCKSVSAFSKKARGSMASFIIRNRLSNVGEMRSFDVDGYRFDRGLSSESEWVFTR